MGKLLDLRIELVYKQIFILFFFFLETQLVCIKKIYRTQLCNPKKSTANNECNLKENEGHKSV